METLLAHAPAGIERCWLSLSGADANENALKLVRQKRDRRPGIIAFRGCFHGRTSAMAEITDRPDFRLGQPPTFPVEYIPFFDRDDEAPGKALAALREVIAAAAIGWRRSWSSWSKGRQGFRTAPREFFVPLFEQCRRAGIAVWVDEVQTFGRVTELFATDLLDLAEYVDVITVGKPLQGSAMLISQQEWRPIRHLMSGTYSGATAAMAVARRMIEKLTERRSFSARQGAKNNSSGLPSISGGTGRTHHGNISHVDGIGAMIAFRIGDGSLEFTRAFIERAFQAGLALYYGGHDPACVRLFLPAGVLTDAELAEAFAIIDRCL